MNVIKPQKPASIYEIAKLAGVSVSTVSRVMNNGLASRKTRQKVEQIIQETGFSPDSRAVGLRKGKTRKVGLIIPRIDNPVYSTTVRLVHDFLRSREYSLVLGITYGSAHEELEALELMQRECVDGVILNICEGEDDSGIRGRMEVLLERGAPLIFIGKEPLGLPADMISVDNRLGFHKLITYLKKTGRRQIGFLAGRENLYATSVRVDAFREALSAVGLEYAPENVLLGEDFGMDDGQRLTRLLIKQGMVDAIVCGNDLMAVGALLAARQCGVAVPDKLAIAGFDDIDLAALVSPALTTVRQPFERITHLACERLFARLEGRVNAGEQFLLEPELIIRDSA